MEIWGVPARSILLEIARLQFKNAVVIARTLSLENTHGAAVA